MQLAVPPLKPGHVVVYNDPHLEVAMRNARNGSHQATALASTYFHVVEPPQGNTVNVLDLKANHPWRLTLEADKVTIVGEVPLDKANSRRDDYGCFGLRGGLNNPLERFRYGRALPIRKSVF